MKFTRAKVIWSLVLVVIIGIVAAAVLYLKPAGPTADALEAMKGGQGVTVADNAKWIVFESTTVKSVEVIFYPGALVKPQSYAPLATLLAQKGYRTYIVKMPLNLAVTAMNRAEEIIDSHPKVMYVLGGHSLGGAMAARYAAQHPDRLKGVFFLGAYPDAKGSLKNTKLSSLTLIGTEDGIVNRDALEQGKAYLPTQADYVEVNGGNHAQFGSYGEQKGDKPARVTPEQQQTLTAAIMDPWLSGVGTR